MAMATDMNQFMSQAESFIKKAKSEGVEDHKIANTIRFMYSVTQQNIANNAANKENLGSIAYNADTGEYYNTLPGGSADVGTYSSPMADTSISASDFGISPTPQFTEPTNTSKSSGFNFDEAANSFTYKPATNMSTPEPNMSTESGPAYAQPTPQPKYNKQSVYKTGSPFIDSLSNQIFGVKF